MSDTISSDVDFDYLANPTVKNDEQVWCKIGADGTLELFDWEFAEKTAREYDATGPAAPKNTAQIICKLAVLIREQTLQRAAGVLNRYAETSADASVVMIKDPLGDEQ